MYRNIAFCSICTFFNNLCNNAVSLYFCNFCNICFCGIYIANLYIITILQSKYIFNMVYILFYNLNFTFFYLIFFYKKFKL